MDDFKVFGAPSTGVAIYDWPHNDPVPQEAEKAARDGKLIGHADECHWLQPTEELTTFGGHTQVIPSPTEPPVLILPNWTPKIATPINLSPPPHLTMTPAYQIIYCLVEMFGGAIHIDQRQWIESEPSQVETRQLDNPWMMQVTIPPKSIS